MTPLFFKNNIQNKNVSGTFLFIGRETYLAKKIILSWKRAFKGKQKYWDFHILNFFDSSFKEILNNLFSISFFDLKKILVVQNPIFLTNNFSFRNLKKEEKEFIKYLKHPSKDVILVIDATGVSLDNRKKVVKEVKNYSSIVNFSRLTEKSLKDYINQKFNKYQLRINNDNINVLLQKTSFDFKKIDKEVSKLIIYSKRYPLNRNVIDILVSSEKNETAFDLIKAINRKEIRKSIIIYNNLIDNGENPVGINALLISQYRLLIQAKIMNVSSELLSKKLRIHPFRAHLAIEDSNKLDLGYLLKRYLYLTKINFLLKTSTIDSKFLFERFIFEK